MSYSAERILSAELIARIQAKVVKPVILVFADFPSGAKRVWTGIGNIEWGGHTWEGVGGAIGFEAVSETTDTSAKGITARINGLDADFAAALVNDAYQGREATIWLGFWDEAETDLEVMSGPLWSGMMDTDQVEDAGDTASLAIQAEHRLVDILRKREFRYTHRDQQLLYPGQGDTGLNKIEKIQDVTIPWGRTQA
jgi:hypothetical protein